MKKEYVKVCPMCGSDRVSAVFDELTGGVRDACDVCGFNKLFRTLPFFPEVEISRLEEFRRELTQFKKRKT